MNSVAKITLDILYHVSFFLSASGSCKHGALWAKCLLYMDAKTENRVEPSFIGQHSWMKYQMNIRLEPLPTQLFYILHRLLSNCLAFSHTLEKCCESKVMIPNCSSQPQYSVPHCLTCPGYLQTSTTHPGGFQSHPLHKVRKEVWGSWQIKTSFISMLNIAVSIICLPKELPILFLS